MTPRERVKLVLDGGKPDVIPIYGETSMDITVVRDLLPPPTGNAARDAIAKARFFGNSSISTGFSFTTETISRDENHHTYRYETGAVWHESYKPTFCREATDLPIKTLDDITDFKMPDPNRPLLDVDFDDLISREVKAYHDAGYFAQGAVAGLWQAIYYYLTAFDNILLWMAAEPEAAHALFELTGTYAVESAKRMLKAGVDAVFIASDFGTGTAPMFSPDMFKQYVSPWLKKVSDVCHENGAYFHLHSHGHIGALMDHIIEAGVDMVNPIGPTDNNDLAEFKERWGDRIVLHGGISTNIATMTNDEITDHVREVVAAGRVGGRFFPRSESGTPQMPKEKLLHYVNVLKQECAKGYE